MDFVLVTNRQGAIYSASPESPGPDWKPGSGFILLNFNNPAPQLKLHIVIVIIAKSKGISSGEFDEWFAVAKEKTKWGLQTHSHPEPPDALMPDG